MFYASRLSEVGDIAIWPVLRGISIRAMLRVHGLGEVGPYAARIRLYNTLYTAAQALASAISGEQAPLPDPPANARCVGVILYVTLASTCRLLRISGGGVVGRRFSLALQGPFADKTWT